MLGVAIRVQVCIPGRVIGLVVVLIVLESSTSKGTNTTSLGLPVEVVEGEVTNERHVDVLSNVVTANWGYIRRDEPLVQARNCCW